MCGELVVRRFDHPAVRRFIPACAGNSTTTGVERWQTYGSSPRVRGTRARRSVGPRQRRFIPACAGNSRASGRCGHSRLRFIPACAGNSEGVVAANSVSDGSSPRVRGTRRSAHHPLPGERFIPACAGNSRCARGWPSRWSVHPRVCGELWNSTGFCRSPVGSSPRVRGTQEGAAVAAGERRFIPACAGNSSATSATSAPFTVHPRVCGELIRPRVPNHQQRGSSPRVRGTRHQGLVPRPRVRFIPACAGNSGRGCRVAARDTVHPRVCGELRVCFGKPIASTGSSPRVRGTPHVALLRFAPLRFIPACAGNSPDGGQAVLAKPVHPRVCGELRSANRAGLRASRFIPACAGNSLAKLAQAVQDRGSSPRVRGTRAPGRLPGAFPRRFIPACAGNSGERWRRSRAWTVHPRVCGELGVSIKNIVMIAGSSPRVRGTRLCRPASCRPPPVHPRVCGELKMEQWRVSRIAGSSPRVRELNAQTETIGADTGSSPRVRGTRDGLEKPGVGERFIPACAGNSPA